MPSKTIITGATVEIELPSPLDAMEFEQSLFAGRVKIGLIAELKNVVIRFPEVSGIGELHTIDHENGKTITIKRLRLRAMAGDILPEIGEDGTIALFTVGDDADTPIVAKHA